MNALRVLADKDPVGDDLFSIVLEDAVPDEIKGGSAAEFLQNADRRCLGGVCLRLLE